MQKPQPKPQQSVQNVAVRQEPQMNSRPHRPEPQKAQKPQIDDGAIQGQNTAGERGGIAKLLARFIPKSLYNPETGKILGVFSAEDLLLIAIILLLIENDGESGEDNTMLICAILYILISDHLDLPI